MTAQQRDRAMRAVSDYAVQLVGRTGKNSFGGASRRTRGSGVQITYRSKPFYPAPLPPIDEQRLIRERACASCELRYAVFGDHRFCPVCGQLPPLVAAFDALAAETVRLDALAGLDAAVAAPLQESGVFERTYVDTIENLVGIVESMAERTFRAAVATPELLKGKGKIFQRLDDFADLFHAELAVDLRGSATTEWSHLQRIWAARHIFTHSDGIIDAKYCAAVPDTPLHVGQRLRVTEADCRSAIAAVAVLCRRIGDSIPPMDCPTT